MDSSAPASKLSSSEVSFPRGGGSVLSAVELKTISNKATEDVLFEQKAASTKKRPAAADQKNRKKQKNKKLSGAASKDDAELVEISHFTFKNMLPGAEVLGQIMAIHPNGLSLGFGDNLTGHVPITSISAEISEQLEKYSAADDSDEEDEEDPTQATSSFKPEMPKLAELFTVGKWLRATVIPDGDKKKSIHLTIVPETVNAHIEAADLDANTIVQGSVKSIEDHGVVFNLGLESTTGFMDKKELKKAGLTISSYKPGQVHLLSIATVNLRAVTVRPAENENFNKKTVATSVSTIDAIHPGLIVNARVSDNLDEGVVLRIFDMADATMTLPHAGEYTAASLKNHFAIGANVRARVIGVISEEGTKKFLLSRSPRIVEFKTGFNQELSESFPIGFIFDSKVEVVGMDREFLYISTGAGNIYGQVHKSHTDPEKIAGIEYPVGSQYRARVLGVNQFDNLLRLSFNPTTIDSKFASVDDITVGEYIPSAEIVQILPENKGVLVKIFGQFDALVPMKHLSDIKLVYPERKFKVGSKFKGRVLDKRGRKILVSLRKTLVNMEDDAVVAKMADLSVGLRTIAVVEKFVKGGAVVSFFNNLRAFLPNNEISESFVKDAADYLKQYQAVSVRILRFNAENEKISVTLRQSSELSDAQATHLETLQIGRSVVKATVAEKTKENIIVELDGSNLRGVIATCHLSDGNYEESRIVYKALEIGSSIDVIILEKDFKNRLVTVSAKKSLINAAKSETLPIHYEDLHVGLTVPGYVMSVTNMGIFVRFCGRLTGLVLPRNATSNPGEDLQKLFFKDQSVSCEVLKLDDENRRFLLSFGVGAEAEVAKTVRLKNPVDSSKKLLSDYSTSDITTGTVHSVGSDHLNIKLADNLIGRIHASQCIESWDSIKNTKTPLSGFKVGQKIKAKVIGFYNTKTHKFSTSGFVGTSTTIELSSLASETSSSSPYKPAVLEDLKVGDEVVAYIDRYEHGVTCLNVAPGVPAQAALYDLSSDVLTFEKFETNFPVGAALKLKILRQDFKHRTLILSARDLEIESYSQLKVGDKMAAKIFKITDAFVLVELGKEVNALSDITEALSDYDQALADVFHVGQAVVATVTSVNAAEQKASVSLRSEKNPKDRAIKSIDDLKRGDLVKGFVKSISDVGLYVTLGRNISALVRVSDISDAFLADWKKFFKPNQCVLGKISQCKGEGRILMTLKESEVNGDLTSYKTFDELEVGQNYDGSVKQAMDFGVFVKLDGTANISGLCHRSEISDNVVENASALFGAGDRVKVKILKIDQDKKQLSLGMKASYFTDIQQDSDVEMEDAEDAESGDDEDNEEMVDFDESADEDNDEETEKANTAKSSAMTGLSTNGFDWTASILDQVEDDESSDDDADNFMNTDKKKRKAKKQVEDKTGEINSRAPQSVGDFERLLVGNPNSSILWMNYMSFQLQLGEIDKSREIAERALKTINYRDEQEKMNIWIAILNLENSFGSDESLAEAFKRSVQYMDSLTMHQKLIGIYQLSEKFDKAEQLFKTMTKKFSQNVAVWVLNGSFFFKREMADEAHQVLARALQALPKRDHIEIVRKFGQLEFSEGDPEQGRSLFEGLITDAPKRIDLWNVYIDQEIKQGDRDRVEALFERVITKKLSKKQAKFFFSKWLSFEEEKGDEQAAARVKALAIEFVQKQSKDEE